MQATLILDLTCSIVLLGVEGYARIAKKYARIVVLEGSKVDLYDDGCYGYNLMMQGLPSMIDDAACGKTVASGLMATT
jgi:hypothetical protein